MSLHCQVRLSSVSAFLVLAGLLAGGALALPSYAPRIAEMNRVLASEIAKVPNDDNAQAKTGIGRWLTEIKSEITADTYKQLLDVAYYVRTLPLKLVAEIAPGNPKNPENVRRVERIMNEAKWKEFFPYTVEETAEGTPEGIGIYSYSNLLKSVGAFPAFCGDYKLHPNLTNVDPDAICKKLLATSFAHFNKETSANARNWNTTIDKQGLYWVREVGCLNGNCGRYTMGLGLYPTSVTSGNTYFGRGAKQLSHPVNYGTLSILLFNDPHVLVKTPDLVADTWLALGSAIYYSVTPIVSKPAIIEVMDGNYRPNRRDLANHFVPGFGLTTHIVNGGIECMQMGGGPRDPTGRTFSQVRGDYFKYYCKQLNVTEPIDPSTLTCEKIRDLFGLESSSSRPYYFGNWGNCASVKYFSQFIAYQGIDGLRTCRKLLG